MERGFTAEIDLRAVSNNFRAIRKMAPGKPVIAVVKADAYGHGAVQVSRKLADEGAEYLAVAFMDEARVLRDAGIGLPIIVLFDTDVSKAFEYGVIPVVGDMKAAVSLSREAESRHRNIKIHIKVDTGMGRLGFKESVQKYILDIAALKGITIEGIMSHFSEADLSDRSFAYSQIEVFTKLRDELARCGLAIPLFHLANSAGVMALPGSHFDAVRPGIMLYGYSPFVSIVHEIPELVPAMSVKARMLAVRSLPAGTPISYGRTFVTKRASVIGVVAAGYADGYNRLFSNNATVLVRGKKAPVVGRVCMDVTMIDVTDIEGVSEKDDVIFIGSQGGENISAADLARWSGTIPYEIMLSIGNRARRVYI